jgi:N-sulfoglucosamine sulfohydrolase
VAKLEKALEDWMVKTNDPLLEGKQTSAQNRKVANKAQSAAKPTDALITVEAPKTIARGQKSVVKVKHAFHSDLGEKPIQVTLKGGGNELIELIELIERKEVKASGAGEIEVAFEIPAEVPGNKVIFAVLVGTSLKDSAQHIQTKPVPVK